MANLLLARNLAAYRAFREHAMPDSCQIIRPNRVSDGAGGFVDSGAATVLGPYIGRFVPVRALTPALQEQFSEHGAYLLVLPYGTDVRPGDRVRILGYDYDITWVETADAYAVGQRAVLNGPLVAGA